LFIAEEFALIDCEKGSDGLTINNTRRDKT